MLLKEFKDFAIKGNVIDLAVGVIIGGSFGKIVTSFVNDVIMPIVSSFGGVDFKELKYVFHPATEKTAEVALKYGNFIQSVVDFTIIAFCIFIMVKVINNMRKKLEQTKEQVVPAPPAPTKEEILLTEIRDLLAKK